MSPLKGLLSTGLHLCVLYCVCLLGPKATETVGIGGLLLMAFSQLLVDLFACGHATLFILVVNLSLNLRHGIF